jgi:hypothetical protein
MIRKLALAVAAIAALGTASLTASTPAAAWGGKSGGGFHHFHGGHHVGGIRIYAGLAMSMTRAIAACGP